MENKKGSVQDLIFLILVLTFFAFATLIGFRIHSGINDQIQTNDMVDTYGKEASTQLNGLYTGTFDNIYLLLAIGMSIVALILAALVMIHPIFIIFYLIAWVIVIFISGVFSNLYQEMASNPSLIAYADQLVIITSVMTYLPLIIGIVGGLLMVFSYKIYRLRIA